MLFYKLLVAPDRVEIRGRETAEVGQTLNFECTTSNSNPASTLHWEVDGRMQPGTTNITDVSSDGGWVSSTNLSVNIQPNVPVFILRLID